MALFFSGSRRSVFSISRVIGRGIDSIFMMAFVPSSSVIGCILFLSISVAVLSSYSSCKGSLTSLQYYLYLSIMPFLSVDIILSLSFIFFWQGLVFRLNCLLKKFKNYILFFLSIKKVLIFIFSFQFQFLLYSFYKNQKFLLMTCIKGVLFWSSITLNVTMSRFISLFSYKQANV